MSNYRRLSIKPNRTKPRLQRASAQLFASFGLGAPKNPLPSQDANRSNGPKFSRLGGDWNHGFEKKHIIHLYVGSCNQANISNSRFQWNLSQHDAKKGAHVNPPALGSCEMSGFSKLQKDILALIDAAIQLKFLMHLGKQRKTAKEKGVLVNVLDANHFFLGEMLKVWYSTPLTYTSQVQWSAHEPLNSMSCCSVSPSEKLCKKEVHLSCPVQLSTSTISIMHPLTIFDSCFTRSLIFLRPKPQQQQLPAPVMSEPKASDK